MYSLKDAWVKIQDSAPYEGWNGDILCVETDSEITFRSNRTQGFIAAYTFTLILNGWLGIRYNGMEMTLLPGDLYLYLPGLPVSIISSSEDYQGICLLADERLSLELGTERDLSGVIFRPIVELHEPILHLSLPAVTSIQTIMKQIRDYCFSSKRGKEEIVKHLYIVFLYEVQNYRDIIQPDLAVSGRMEDLYIAFLKLLPANFTEHHDIPFYASEIGVSSIYLSRVVRRISGRTVMDHINELLVSEAKYLLRSTEMGAAQIADILHFADIPSFSKFFSRMVGISPRRYRTSS
ncbi:MAG: AraC family transcriptional regulator [Bacteroidales bacterium]|nr:AraC family transcriptional regulator [Bacteroidales bacterium]